jgi:TonB-dependent SusC/RagA subfamily outer membrane receptor
MCKPRLMRFVLTIALLLSSLYLAAQIRPATQGRVFDGKMNLQRCSVSVKTDGITAITFIELEFQNNRDVEIEGLFKFQLRSGQVVTDFQLDLNGKYREGSIEEKWKATNAYNTIVGKRVDPALLTKEQDNNYSLRIYPVPAKKSRKVTITLHEVLYPMTAAKNYFLPMNSSDTTSRFAFRFEATQQSIKPFFKPDRFSGVEFIATSNGFIAEGEFRSVVLNQSIDVVLPSAETQRLLVKPSAENVHFALELKNKLQQYYSISPKSVTVFWDASASGEKRDIQKEISFLKQYLRFHQTETITLIPFRHKPLGTFVFQLKNKGIQKLEANLNALEYAGATSFGNLNFSTVRSDLILLFSDGYNSIGKSRPKEGNVLLYALHTSASADTINLKTVSGTGGTVINLGKRTINSAIEQASVAERMLIRVESASGKTIIESILPMKIDKAILLYGTMYQPTDSLRVYFGNNQSVSSVETIPVTNAVQDTSSGIDRLAMLMRYRTITQSKDWNDVLDFGLDERVVTLQTAFLVLERIEDYIRYNITPSKDLEEECRRLNYVKTDTRIQRRALQNQTIEAELSSLVWVYNQRIKAWDAKENALQLQAFRKPTTGSIAQTSEQSSPGMVHTPALEQALQGRAAGISITSYNHLDEVVVVGYGLSRRRELTGSVAVVRSHDVFLGYANVPDALAGRIPGLQVTGNTGQPGGNPGISIRGTFSFATSNQPLFIIDGVPIDGASVHQFLNVNDVESVTVVKDASAGALYGSRAANGAILIQLKKGRNYNYGYQYSQYKLREQEDVEYIVTMKETPKQLKVQKYHELKEGYTNSAAFHLDIAEHLYAHGINDAAFTALMSAVEIIPSDFFMQRTAGFILDRWKQFDEAAEIFAALLSEHPSELYLYRDLAWVYFQQRKYQEAVDLLNKGILYNFGEDETKMAGLKAMLLNDMNAMIEINRYHLDLSSINPSIIKALPADLMIVAEDNGRSRLAMQINEPGLQSIVGYRRPSKHGGFITTEENEQQLYYTGIETYTSRNAKKGTYKVRVNYYAGRSYDGKRPAYVRVCVFRNFGKPDQSIQVETIAMDNQYGEIEIAEIRYQ